MNQVASTADPFNKLERLAGKSIAIALANAFVVSRCIDDVYTCCRFARREAFAAVTLTPDKGKCELAGYIDGLCFKCFDFDRHPQDHFTVAQVWAHEYLG